MSSGALDRNRGTESSWERAKRASRLLRSTRRIHWTVDIVQQKDEFADLDLDSKVWSSEISSVLNA